MLAPGKVTKNERSWREEHVAPRINELRSLGLSIREIESQLKKEFPPEHCPSTCFIQKHIQPGQEVRKAVEKEILDQCVANGMGSREDIQQIISDALNQAYEFLEKEITVKQWADIHGVILKYLDMRIKLLGLYAPIKTENIIKDKFNEEDYANTFGKE
jgi:DNA-binding transcriptional MerR regulator